MNIYIIFVKVHDDASFMATIDDASRFTVSNNSDYCIFADTIA